MEQHQGSKFKVKHRFTIRPPVFVYRSTYEKKDTVQKYMVSTFFPQTVQTIVKKYQEVQKPLNILDLCSGYGFHANQFYNALVQKNVEINEIVGYDYSEELVQLATKKYSENNPKLKFRCIEVETELFDNERFDVVYSFYGLHWLKDLPSAIENVFYALKEGGLLISFNSNEAKIDDCHKEFAKTSHWKTQLEERQYQFVQFPSVATYSNLLKQHFDCQIFQQRRFPITNTKLFWRNTFEGYFEEVRCLTRDLESAEERQKVAATYLDEFINSLPFIEGEVEPKGDELMVNYCFTYFEARKKFAHKQEENAGMIEI